MENRQVQLIYHTKPYKMMVLCNNLVSDSENRSTYQWYVCVWSQTLLELLYLG